MYRPEAICSFCGSNAIFCVDCDEIICLNENCENYDYCQCCRECLAKERYADELPERDYYEGDSPDF